jgi:hypothetical protein
VTISDACWSRCGISLEANSMLVQGQTGEEAASEVVYVEAAVGKK